jgi:hypothetical protein
MPPETPGRATPRDPSVPEPKPGSSPTFKGGAEQVDEQTAGAPRPPTTGADSLPYASDDRPRRRPERKDEPRATGARYAKTAKAPKATKADPATKEPASAPGAARRPPKVRARKVRRIVRHIDPWSVLKISVLFFTAIFLIICVASAVLWSAARSSGAIEDVESFVTSVGGFGNCEAIEGEDGATTSTTVPGATTTAPVNQLDPAGGATTVPAGPVEPVDAVDDEDCPEGQQLVGEFKFEDERIFQAFALAGIVLVLSGAATAVVLTLLFNLISDLTGGVRVTVLEEEPPPRLRAGSPDARPRD